MSIKSYMESERPYLHSSYGVEEVFEDYQKHIQKQIDRKTFYQWVKKEFKEKPVRMLNRYRISRAVKILKAGYIGSLDHLAEECGYNNPHTFCYWFFKITHRNPGEFRRAHRYKNR